MVSETGQVNTGGMVSAKKEEGATDEMVRAEPTI
jgi:hypothetical protein